MAEAEWIEVRCPDCGAVLTTLRFPQPGSISYTAPCPECPAWWTVDINSNGCRRFEVTPPESRWDRDAD